MCEKQIFFVMSICLRTRMYHGESHRMGLLWNFLFRIFTNITRYLYCCTVHFEDSLIIEHQQMH
jgi:hypothetical protein